MVTIGDVLVAVTVLCRSESLAFGVEHVVEGRGEGPLVGGPSFMSHGEGCVDSVREESINE